MKKKHKIILIISALFLFWVFYQMVHFDDDKTCWDIGGKWENNKCFIDGQVIKIGNF